VSKHKIASWVKSWLRLTGAGVGMVAFWHHPLQMHAFAFLFVAEIVGVIEEEFEK
jgi:lysophospholipid acyltransferase (LPLAT)-like uncharacterized protein